jgi:hypothetical protein
MGYAMPEASAYEAAAVINEIHYNGASLTDPEWIELTNKLSIDVDLGGWKLSGGVDFSFPAGTILRAGGFLVISDNPAVLQTAAGIPGVLGPWTGSLSNGGETLRLRDMSGRLMEEVTYNDRGRWPSGADGSGATLSSKGIHTSGRTADGLELSKRIGGSPGAANDVPQLAPPVTVFGDAGAWLYHDTSGGLAAGWQNTAYVAGSGSWLSGNGVLAFEDAALPAPIGTTLATPAAHATGTYYFQKQFSVSGIPASRQWTLRTLVDDGAVIFLNGVQLTRRNMPSGTVAATTAAAAEVGNADFADISIPASALVSGTNTLSVEVHNVGRGVTPVFRLMATGGSMDNSANMALSGTAIAKDLLAGFPAHTISHINDGIYGNPNSWIGSTATSWAGIGFSSLRQIGRIAWGRDNTGILTDRANGSYTVQYTTALNPTNATPNASWTTIGSITMDGIIGSPALRHLLDFPAVNASGIRITTPNGGCIDEIELYSPVIPDVVWGASLTSREIIPPASSLPIVINEIGGALDGVWRVELKNTGSTAIDLGGLILAGSDAPLAGLTLPPQMLAAGEVLVLDETQLGFRPGTDDRLFLYSAGRVGVVDSAIARDTGRARSADGKMLTPTAATFGTANAFALNSAIVISEVMYHFPNSREEWIELHNKSGSSVDVSGWRLDDAVSFTFPGLPGSNATVIPAGGYLVVAGNAPALLAKWPGVPILGNFTGSLNNRGERIALEDASSNLAAEVTYADGGKWPSLADGGGSSLELRDAAADNAHPASWAASDESAKSTMQTITYRLTASQPSAPSNWNEFRLGMLDAGTCLIDDLSVKRDPNGAAQQLIQNGAFANTSTWRLLGNHNESSVVTDGVNGSVLKLASTGPAETNHNHAETTFTSNTALVNGTVYEVSFRARWISGSNKLGTRGYFSRIAKAHDLPMPENLGTPGAANSRASTAGPSLSALRHTPVMPAVLQPVTVSCTVSDSRPVTNVTLNYGTGGALTPVAMTAAGNTWSATIPAQPAGTVVQFFVFAANNAGGTSALPAAGAASRALYIVNDGQASNIAARELRVLMLPADRTSMLATLNLLSNKLTGGTLVAGGTAVFYDVGVRMQGAASSRARDGVDYQSFNVELNADEPYLGTYGSVGFDRSARTPANRRPDEIYGKHLFHRAGLPATRDDLAYLIGPTTTYTGHCILQLNSYGGDFPDDQFGTEGSVFNYDGTYDPTTNSVSGDVQSVKNPTPFVHFQTDLVNLGDKEHYRAFYDIRAGKERDDYAPLMAMCTAMGLPAGAAFDAETNARIDVDQWMRCTALVNLLGVDDTWFTRGLAGGYAFNHNVRFWVPTTGKVVVLPWDMDFLLKTAINVPLNNTAGNLAKLIARPANNRAYLAHVRDLCMTALDPTYVQTWLTHYGGVTNHNYSASVSWLSARRTYALSQLPASVPFAITTNGGADFSVNAHTTTLTGTGYLDIRSILRNGSAIPLNLRWTNNTTWTADLALVSGANVITLDAIAFEGSTLSSDTITITNTLPAPQPRDFLRITEVHYNPADPANPAETAVSLDNEEFEFIELINTGTGTLDLTGVQFTQAITFSFAGGTTLAAGARIVVVLNIAAFQARYGTGLHVAGTYVPGNLNNGGETLTLVDATGTVIQSFTYSDDWAPLSDGGGRSLVIRDPSAPVGSWDTAAAWALSAPGGSPGADSGLNVFTQFVLWQQTHFTAAELADPSISGPDADPAGSGISNLVRYAIGLTPSANPATRLPRLQTDGSLLYFEFFRLKSAVDVVWVTEVSSGLDIWRAVADPVQLIATHPDGTEQVRLPVPVTARSFARLRITN